MPEIVSVDSGKTAQVMWCSSFIRQANL